MSKLKLDGTVKIQRWECPNVEADDEAGDGAYKGHVKGPLTVEKISNIQRMAYKEAYDEGFASGYKDGAKKLSESLQVKVGIVTELLNALSDPIKQLDNEVQEQLIQLATVLARQLVRRELKNEPGELVAIVKEAIAALPVVSKSVRVLMHPEDAAQVRKVLSLDSDDSPWQLIDDLSLDRGDCCVSTETSTIDARLETRLTSIIVNMMGGARTSDAEETQDDT